MGGAVCGREIWAVIGWFEVLGIARCAEERSGTYTWIGSGVLDFQHGNPGFVIEFGGGKCASLCFSSYLRRGFSVGLICIWRWSFGVVDERKVLVLQCGLEEAKWLTFKAEIVAQNSNSFYRGK
ncbi:hypothetical protein FF1_026936 [Malus domestica]